jgi:hypothetical protein
MFEFESQFRSADPARASDTPMPDFLAIARRVASETSPTSLVPRSPNRMKVFAIAMAFAVLLTATLASLTSNSAPTNRSARKIFWNLPSSANPSGSTGFVSGNNFRFVASQVLSRAMTPGTLFEVKSSSRPLVEFVKIAHAFGVSTSSGVTSTSQPKQIKIFAGNSSSSKGSMTYLSYSDAKSSNYTFSSFQFAANDADKLLFSDAVATQPDQASQRSYLSAAQTAWSALKSGASLDGVHATWQVVQATSPLASQQTIVRLSVPLLVEGYGFGHAATFEFDGAGHLISANGPDVAIAKVVSVILQSPTSGVSNLNLGLNIPCNSINAIATSGSQLSSFGSTTTTAAARVVDITSSSVVYSAQRTSNKSVWLIPFFQFSGHLGSLGIDGFLGTAAMSSKQISITQSLNGSCTTKLLVH